MSDKAADKPVEGTVRVTLTRSLAGQLACIRNSARGLGLRRIGQSVVVVLKFVVLGYLGWRLKGSWRCLGLGLLLGGALANVGNWLITHAVVDFLVMPWATVNLADLLIDLGAVVIGAGWAARLLRHLARRRRPVAQPTTPEPTTTLPYSPTPAAAPQTWAA